MTYIPEAMRRAVIQRAQGKCEYCQLHQDDSVKQHEIDHIDAEKHGGTTTLENLCYCCFDCNRHKGSDLASIDPDTGQKVFLYHPRQNQWSDHFKVEGASVIPNTQVGRVTVFLLQMNAPERLIEREILVKLGRYPR